MQNMADIKKERFHEETLKYMKLAPSLGFKPFSEYENPNDIRALRKKLSPQLRGTYDFNGTVDDIKIPSKDVPGGIPVYVYKPSGLCKNPCIWVYFHGGGFVVGSREEVDTMCKMISQEAGCIVVNVEYRLSPEHKFPASFDDGQAAVTWVLQNKPAIGGTENSAVGVGGDSAGGAISSSLAHDVSGLAFQILIYPRVTYRLDLPSAQEFAGGPFLDLKSIKWFSQHTYKSDEDYQSPRGKVLHRDRFDHVPPVLFIVAEIDMLRDESYAYKEKLEEAGVKCDLLEVKGVPHGFFILPATYRENTAIAYKKAVDFIQTFQ